jgi:8-oxo-dGTP diphosphatase
VSVYVVRHGKAGNRDKWQGPDDLRPLTKAGRRQAEGVADWLESKPITRIVTSPSVRCRQTIEPLAERLRLPVDLSDALAEGADVDGALQLLDKLGGEVAVVCTHGDVLGDVIGHASRHGASLEGNGLEKAGTWVLDLEAGAITSGRYVGPPTDDE